MPAYRPLVSFVLTCYNYGRFLPDCLNAIFHQEGGYDFEIIAVDDASTDNTAEVLESFRDPRLRVIRHAQNQGHGRTFADGVLAARGELLARIDPDDRHRPCFLSRTVPIFEKHPEVGMVYGDVCLIDETGRICHTGCDRLHGGKDFKGCELIELLQENFICAPTIIARRECFSKHLPVPQHLAFHDWYFTLKMAQEAEFYYVDSILADYRVHANNLHGKVILNRTEEPSILWMLEHVYGSNERTAELQRKKLEARGKVFGRQYRTLADKYFAADMNSDARRCYWMAIRYYPRHLFSVTVVRFMATIVGRGNYERMKGLWKRLAPASARARSETV